MERLRARAGDRAWEYALGMSAPAEPTLFDAVFERTERTERSAPARQRREKPQQKPKPKPRAVDRYETMTRAMLAEFGVRVRKWRSSTSGVAWQLTYANGAVSRLIESPRPRGPISAAVFLHEIGHHAIGFDVYKPRCLEEYHAWMFAIRQMERWEIQITPSVENRVHDALHYAITKAARRGLKRLPEELAPYLQPRRTGSSIAI